MYIHMHGGIIMMFSFCRKLIGMGNQNAKLKDYQYLPLYGIPTTPLPSPVKDTVSNDNGCYEVDSSKPGQCCVLSPVWTNVAVELIVPVLRSQQLQRYAWYNTCTISHYTLVLGIDLPGRQVGKI